jgi:hypothetical protein
MAQFQRGWVWLLAVAALWQWTSAAAWAQPKVEPFELPRDGRGFIPKQKHQPLNGRVIGVLVGNPTAVLAHEGRFGPGNQVCLSVDGYSYRWIYVQTDDANAMIQNLTVLTKSGGPQVFPRLNIASAREVARWNVVPDALVEVEVNDDKGSQVSDSFVATEMRRLDGTRNYPLNVSKVLADSRNQWDKWYKDQAKVVAAKMTEAQKKAIGERKPNVPRNEQLLQYVTWMSESKRLQVRYLLRVSEGEVQQNQGGENIDRPGRPVPDVIRPIDELKKRPLPGRPIRPVQPVPVVPPVDPVPERPEGPVPLPMVEPVQVEPVQVLPGGGVVIGRPGGPVVIQPVVNSKHYGVEVGVAFEYSHTGELVRILTLEPQTFVQNQANPGDRIRPRPVPLPVVPQPGNVPGIRPIIEPVEPPNEGPALVPPVAPAIQPAVPPAIRPLPERVPAIQPAAPAIAPPLRQPAIRPAIERELPVPQREILLPAVPPADR